MFIVERDMDAIPNKLAVDQFAAIKIILARIINFVFKMESHIAGLV